MFFILGWSKLGVLFDRTQIAVDVNLDTTLIFDNYSFL